MKKIGFFLIALGALFSFQAQANGTPVTDTEVASETDTVTVSAEDMEDFEMLGCTFREVPLTEADLQSDIPISAQYVVTCPALISFVHKALYTVADTANTVVNAIADTMDAVVNAIADAFENGRDMMYSCQFVPVKPPAVNFRNGHGSQDDQHGLNASVPHYNIHCKLVPFVSHDHKQPQRP